jgi:hypothetical protein
MNEAELKGLKFKALALYCEVAGLLLDVFIRHNDRMNIRLMEMQHELEGVKK